MKEDGRWRDQLKRIAIARGQGGESKESLILGTVTRQGGARDCDSPKFKRRETRV